MHLGSCDLFSSSSIPFSTTQANTVLLTGFSSYKNALDPDILTARFLTSFRSLLKLYFLIRFQPHSLIHSLPFPSFSPFVLLPTCSTVISFIHLVYRLFTLLEYNFHEGRDFGSQLYP